MSQLAPSPIGGWSMATIGEIVDILDSQRVPVNAKERAARQGTIPYYGATGQVGWIDDFIFDEELVLLGEDGAPFLDSGKNVAYMINGKSWVNNHAHVLRMCGGCPNAFLMHQLNQIDYTSFVSGTTRLKLTKGKLCTIPLVVPPLDEQHRIVEALESYLSRLDAAVESLERVQRNLKRYRASVLQTAIEGRLVETEAELARQEGRDYEHARILLERILKERRHRWEETELAKMKAKGKTPKDNKWKAKYKEPSEPDTDGLPELPKGWCWATLDALTDQKRPITYGVIKLGDVQPEGIPTLRSSNVRHLRLDLDYVKPIDPDISAQYGRTILEGGELLVTIRGTLGGIAVAPMSCRGFNISREVALISLIEPSLNSSIATMIGSPHLQSWMNQRLKGITYRGLNIETLKKLPIPIPPQDEQHRLSDAVSRYLSVDEILASKMSAQLKHCTALRQSVLKWAFEGKLVDQDPDDEPAAILLDRIKTERKALLHKTRARSPRIRRKAERS